MSEPQPGLAQSRAQVHSLAQARARARGRSCDPQPGQICLARPDRGADLVVLVVAVRDGQVEVLLCGHECDWATETDSVLEPTATGYLSRLLVHGDVSGQVLTTRLHATIGRVPPELAERIALRGRGLDFGSTDLGRGRAILDESDPRWEWKLESFRRMRGIRARAGELGWSLYTLGDPSPRGA